jgi:hypothetical protein
VIVESVYAMITMAGGQQQAAAAEGGGHLNLIFQAEGDGYSASEAFTTSLGAPGPNRAIELTRKLEAPPHGAGSNGTPVPSGCSATTQQTQTNWAVIGELHKWLDTTVRFTFASSKSSTLGVGISESGANGSWSVDGSFSVTNSAGSYMSWSPTDSTFGHQLESQFTYAKSYEPPVFLCNHGVCVEICTGQYWAFVTTWQGSLRIGNDVSKYDGKCGSGSFANFYPPNATFGTASEKAYTYKSGISVFGFGFSSQSGYSTSVAEEWKFGTKYGSYWLCGNNAKPPLSSIVYAGPDDSA